MWTGSWSADGTTYTGQWMGTVNGSPMTWGGTVTIVNMGELTWTGAWSIGAPILKFSSP